SCLPWFVFSSRRRHTRSKRDWSSDVCSSDLYSFIDTRSCRDNESDCYDQYDDRLRQDVIFYPVKTVAQTGSNLSCTKTERCCDTENRTEYGQYIDAGTHPSARFVTEYRRQCRTHEQRCLMSEVEVRESKPDHSVDRPWMESP